MSKTVLSVEEGMAALMGIIEGADLKPVETKSGKTILVPAAKPAPTVTYENGRAIMINEKKVTTGPKKKGGSRAAKDDAGKNALKAIYEPLFLAEEKNFKHSTEGVVVRKEEADYTIKVTKSKEMKFDPADEEFEVEKDFTVRGKAKNSAPAIAKALLAALEADDIEFTLIAAKASGIVLHMMGGEYTIKISKKRDRVGFEAEKAASYK